MAYRLGLTDVENAFLPSKDIDTAEKFAGRVHEVETAYYALHSIGTNVAIIGNRGIGKTSLARQIINIASGNNELVEKLGLPHEDKLDFLAVYHACGRSVTNYLDLLHQILTRQDCLADWVYDIPSAYKEVRTLKPGIDLKLISIGGDLQNEQEKSRAIATHTLDTIFTNVLSLMVKAEIARDGILIVVDEFDQIQDPSGFASFLKSLATNVPGVKFCLVGVAQDIRNLMKEHESSDRLFAGSIINLPPMTDTELKEIIRIAEHAVHHEILFEDEAADELVDLARGHPYMVHLLGKYALRQAYRNNKFKIDIGDIQDALSSIAEREADPVLEGRYKKAIAASPQRESVLKAMATSQREDGEVFTTEAYKLALDDGVDNASQYVGQLVTEDYGAELIKIRDRYYRFKDSLFHAYVRARPRFFKARR